MVCVLKFKAEQFIIIVRMSVCMDSIGCLAVSGTFYYGTSSTCDTIISIHVLRNAYYTLIFWGGGGAICKNRLIAQTLVRTCTVLSKNTFLIIFIVLTKMTPFSIPFGVKRPLNIPRIYSFGQKHTLEYTVTKTLLIMYKR